MRAHMIPKENNWKTMRVLVISYSFPPSAYGASTLMRNLFKYLPKESFTVMTVDSGMANAAGDYDPEYALDCSAIRLPVRDYGVKAGIKFLCLSIIRGLTLNKRREFDCLLAVYPPEYDLYAAYVLHKMTRKPHIIYMHELFEEVRRGARLYRIWCSVERKIFSSASAIIVTNDKFKRHYLGKGIDNVTVLPSCVDLDREELHETSGKTCPTPHGRLRIVFTGGVSAANEDAIICLLKTAEHVGNIEVIFATTDNRSYLKNVSRGFVPKKECYELQRSADVLLLPLSFGCSYPEEIQCAFPMKTLDYLVAGKPILAIVPKGTFAQDFVEKNNVGIVVTELSEQKIADAIESLRDEELREGFSKNAFKTALRYDARIQAKRLYTIVKNVLSSSSRAQTSSR